VGRFSLAGKQDKLSALGGVRAESAFRTVFCEFCEIFSEVDVASSIEIDDRADDRLARLVPA